MHFEVCEGEEKERNTCACSITSPGRAGCGMAWQGEARQWVRAHDVRVNSLPKFGPKPHRSAASFYRLFLLRDCV
jgi:hypothetical protein